MAERQLLSFQAFCPVIFLQPIFSSLFYNPLMSCHVHTGSLSQRANMQYTMSQAELQVGSCVQVFMHTHVLVCVVIAGASLANCIKIIIHPKVVTISNWNSIQNGGKFWHFSGPSELYSRTNFVICTLYFNVTVPTWSHKNSYPCALFSKTFYMSYCTFRRSFEEKFPLSGAKTQVQYVNSGTFLLRSYRHVLLCFYNVALGTYCDGSEFKYRSTVAKNVCYIVLEICPTSNATLNLYPIVLTNAKLI